MSFYKFLVFYIFVTFSGICYGIETAPATDQFSFRSGFATFQSDNYYGSQINATLADKVNTDLKAMADIGRLERDYSDDTKVTELTYSLGSTYTFSPNFYSEANLSVTPRAVISAENIFSLTPHWVNGTSDWAIKFQYSHYANLDAGIFVPSLYQEIGLGFAAYLSEYIVRSSQFLFASQAKLNYVFFDRQKLSAGASFGQTLEDAGLEARFKSFAVEYTYNFRSWSIGLAQNKYWSTIRREDSYLLSVEFR